MAELDFTPAGRLIDDFIRAQSPFQKALLIPLRETILRETPDLKESFRWSTLTYSGTKGPAVVIHLNAEFVSLVFPRGDELNDPQSLLRGEGKSRSLLFDDPDDFDPGVAVPYLQQAASL